MTNVVKLLRSTTSTHVPGSLVSGQLAINEADARLFYLGSDGSTIKGFRPPMIGELIEGSESTPIDCLPCDGSSYANSSYPALQALIGNRYAQCSARTYATSDVSNACFAVCYASGLGLFLAGGGVSSSGANKIWSSSDGHTFTSRDTTASWGQTTGIDWSGSVALAVSNHSTGKCMNSSNGTSWTAKTAFGTPLQQGCLKWGSSLFVGVDTAGPFAIKTTTDGTTWTSRTSPASGAEAALASGLATDGTNFVLMSQTSGVYYVSANGTSWTRKTGGPASAQWLIYANGYFLLQTSAGYYISTDAGTTWTAVSFPGELLIAFDNTNYHGSIAVSFSGYLSGNFVFTCSLASTSYLPGFPEFGTGATFSISTTDFINWQIAGSASIGGPTYFSTQANNGTTIVSPYVSGASVSFYYWNYDTDTSHFRVPKIRPKANGRRAFIKAL